MPRTGPRTPEQNARENAQAKARRTQGYIRPPRTQREIEASRERSRRKVRTELDWPEERLDAQPWTWRKQVARGRRRKLVGSEPLPESCTGHPLFKEARNVLHRGELAEFDRDMDTIARDLIGAYVLARLEGEDPLAAVAAERRRFNHDRKALVFGLPMTDGLER